MFCKCFILHVTTVLNAGTENMERELYDRRTFVILSRKRRFETKNHIVTE